MFEGVGSSHFREAFFEGFLRDTGRDDDIEGFGKAGELAEDFKVFLRSEVMSLVAVGDEVGDEDFFGF